VEDSFSPNEHANPYFMGARVMPEISYSDDTISAGFVKVIGDPVSHLYAMCWQVFEVASK